MEVSNIICPNLRQSHLYHYNTIAGIGYFGYYFSFYCYKYLRFAKNKPMKFQFEEGDVETQSTLPEVAVKMIMLVLMDNILSI